MTSVPSSTTSPPEPGAVELFTARSGAPSLRVGGRALHSPYDPVREASRYVADQLGNEPPSTVVVLGEGLGHVTAAVRASFPEARVLAVFYAEEIRRMAGADPAASWSPGTGLPLGAFLRRALGELSVEGLRVVEWPATAQAFPDVSRSAAQALRSVVQELNGSFATACAAGRLWLRNSIANFLGIDAVRVGPPCAPDRPVLVAAPGPSLERSVELIAEHRRRLELWALPSSCPLLADAGLLPDLVVLSDPGYYAMHHVTRSRINAAVAMPLSAARGVWSMGGPRTPAAPLLLGQPVFYERALLAEAGVQCPEIVPHGTVAATAIDLAMGVTAAPVIVAGLDMCMRDIRSHARPNAFDDLLQLASSRPTPHASLWYERALFQNAERLPDAPGFRASPSLRTYAGWFDDAPVQRAPFRLLPSPVPLAGMKDLDAPGMRRLLADLPARTPSASPASQRRLPPLSDRKGALARLARTWQGTIAAARPEFAWQDAPQDPGASPTAFSIAFMLEPRGLMDARRSWRVGRHGEGMEAARKVMEACDGFLQAIAERVASGD